MIINDLKMTKNILLSPDNLQSPAELQLSRPKEVRWALILLWLCFSFIIAQYLLVMASTVSTLPADKVVGNAILFSMAVPGVLFVFDGYLNVKIAHGRNWARIVKLLLVVANAYLQTRTSTPLTELQKIEVASIHAMNFSAMYLLFVSSGRQWFGRAVQKHQN